MAHTGTNRRVYERYEFLAQVQVSRDADVRILSTQNISYGGVFIQGSPADYPELVVGAVVEVAIFAADTPGDGDVTTLARIVWTEDGQRPGTVPGFGVEFLWESEAHRAQLARLLKRCE